MNCSNIYVASPVLNIRNTNISEVNAITDDIVDNILNIIKDAETGMDALLYLNPKSAYINIQNSTIYLYFQVCPKPTLGGPLSDGTVKILLKNKGTQFFKFDNIRQYIKLYLDDIEKTKNLIKNEIYKVLSPKTGPRPIYQTSMVFQEPFRRSSARRGGLRMGEMEGPIIPKKVDRFQRQSTFSKSQYIVISMAEMLSLYLGMNENIENAKYREATRIFNIANKLETEKVKEIYNYIVNNKIDDLYVNLKGTQLDIDKNYKFVSLYINVISIRGKALSVYDDVQEHITGFNLGQISLSKNDLPNSFPLHEDYDMVMQFIEDNIRVEINDLPPLSMNENDMLEEVD